MSDVRNAGLAELLYQKTDCILFVALVQRQHLGV